MNFNNTHKTYTVDEATARLMRFCAYRDRCHQEVEKKLKEMRMIPEAQQEIIYRLIQEKFLNEERFARSFARGKFRIKKWGRVRIVRELKQRNISKFNIDCALTEIDSEKYQLQLEALLEKRLAALTEKNKYKLRKKLADYVLYRGYESHLVYEAIREMGC